MASRLSGSFSSGPKERKGKASHLIHSVQIEIKVYWFN
jgi:hypothetical protein